MSKEVEQIILKSLVSNQEYTTKVIPYLKKDYFTVQEHVYIYEIISNFIEKYNNLPTSSAINIGLEKIEMSENIFQTSKKVVKEIFNEDNFNVEDEKWLYDTTLKFVKNQALFLALKEVAFIADEIENSSEKKDTSISETKIPEILKEAISIDFNTQLGQDYIEDAEERFERYQKLEEKVPFYLDIFNTITNGGANKGFIHFFIAGTSIGKSLFKTSFTADDLRLGHNVLYITLELDQDIISKRIDANLMDVDINNVHLIGSNTYLNNINNLKKKTLGKVVVMEDFTGKFSSKKLEIILDDLKLKKNFVPDKVYIDYLKKCKSTIYKQGSVNTNTYYGSVSEEFRNLARRKNFALFTSFQLNRSGHGDSDANETDIADAWDIVQNADWVGIILTSDELRELGQVEIKQAKTKYSNGEENFRFYLGMDKNKMKIYELDSKYSGALNNPIVKREEEKNSSRYNELNFD